MGPLLICSVMAVLQGVSLLAGDDGSGVTDDSEIVCLSDRVMAGRHSHSTHQARREEIRGEEEEGGSLAALSFNPGGRGQQKKKKKLKAAINVSLHIHVHVGRLLIQQCIAFSFGDLANKWTLCLAWNALCWNRHIAHLAPLPVSNMWHERTNTYV